MRQENIDRCLAGARISSEIVSLLHNMTLQAKHLRLSMLILALLAGIVISQLTPLLADTSHSHRMCLYSLQICTGCSMPSPEVSDLDSCCVTDGGCGNEQTEHQGEPNKGRPAGGPSDSDCNCCVLITMTTPLVSDSSAPHQLFSVLCVEDVLFSAACHSYGWVDSLLRPPSV